MAIQRIRITKGAFSQMISVMAFERMNKDIPNHGWVTEEGAPVLTEHIPAEILEFKRKRIEELKSKDAESSVEVEGAVELKDETTTSEDSEEKTVKSKTPKKPAVKKKSYASKKR